MAPLPGTVFLVARAAGLELPRRGEKRHIRCPFHDDRHPSAFVSIRNVLYCCVCTPGGGWTARRFAQELGVPWRGVVATGSGWSTRRRPSTPFVATDPQFRAEEAEHVWKLALDRADGGDHPADEDVFGYLQRHGPAAAAPHPSSRATAAGGGPC
ncbi:MAG: hypothetical protein JNL90_10625 [Planctomycetes bacterium]|nr:hypothetical protein [Planctomycetota bacterium]